MFFVHFSKYVLFVNGKRLSSWLCNISSSVTCISTSRDCSIYLHMDQYNWQQKTRYYIVRCRGHNKKHLYCAIPVRRYPMSEGITHFSPNSTCSMLQILKRLIGKIFRYNILGLGLMVAQLLSTKGACKGHIYSAEGTSFHCKHGGNK